MILNNLSMLRNVGDMGSKVSIKAAVPCRKDENQGIKSVKKKVLEKYE